MRFRGAALALFVMMGCRTQPFPATGTVPEASPDVGSPPSDLATAPADLMTPTSCLLYNYLDRDSFEVVASNLEQCYASTTMCDRSAKAVHLYNLEEGVGDVVFDYSDELGGTHHLTVRLPNSHRNSDIYFEGFGIPAAWSLETALTSIFEATSGKAPPPCRYP